MNLSDLTTLVTPLVGVLCATAGAHASGSPWWASAIAGIAGFALGIAVAVGAYRLFGRLLDAKSKGTAGILAFAGYMLLPLAILFITAAGTIFLATLACAACGWSPR